MTNITLLTDSYKFSHWLQYPEKSEYVNSYIEARGFAPEVKDLWENEIVFFGLQAFIKEYLSKPLTREDIEEAKELAELHGTPFNYEGFLEMLKDYGGYWPVSIWALPEGTVAPYGNALVQIVNTDPKYFWATSYLEKDLLRAIWYPTTVATQSREIKKVIKKYLLETAGHAEGLEFKLHDFGARGVSSSESAKIGGGAHLVNFMGTDTSEALIWLRNNYGEKMAGYSIPAAEHSTITTWGGRKGEVDSYRNMLKQFGGKYPIIAVVSDSYDIYNAVENLWGGVLKDEVIALGEMGSKLVIRPDSGDPTEVPVECIELLKWLSEATMASSRLYLIVMTILRACWNWFGAMALNAGKQLFRKFVKGLLFD
jgi:nicotinamide phosphoribosyltransferase